MIERRYLLGGLALGGAVMPTTASMSGASRPRAWPRRSAIASRSAAIASLALSMAVRARASIAGDGARLRRPSKARRRDSSDGVGSDVGPRVSASCFRAAVARSSRSSAASPCAAAPSRALSGRGLSCARAEAETSIAIAAARGRTLLADGLHMGIDLVLHVDLDVGLGAGLDLGIIFGKVHF